MSNTETPIGTVRSAALAALLSSKPGPARAISDDEDPFAALDMNSMETFRAIVRIEKAFSVSIGDAPDDFDRIRTLRGLCELLRERAPLRTGEANR